MLNSIINNNENTGSIILFDSVEIEAFGFLKAILKKLSDSGNYNIHFYCYVHKPSKFQSCIQHSVKFHDYTNHITGLNSHGDGEHFPHIDINEAPKVVFIDNLNRLINLSNAQKVCKLLNQFKFNEHKLKLVSIYHLDLHKDNVTTCIEHYCQSIVTLNSLYNSSDSQHFAKSLTLHKSKNGKTKRATEIIRIVKNFDFFISAEKIKQESNVVENDEDPLANLTFKVSLKSNEVTAKDKLDPPFLGKLFYFQLFKRNISKYSQALCCFYYQQN